MKLKGWGLLFLYLRKPLIYIVLVLLFMSSLFSPQNFESKNFIKIAKAAGPYYWVGGSGNTSDATNHWATSSGGAPNVANIPSSTDDVVFDTSSAAAGYTVTVDTAFSVANLTYTGVAFKTSAITLAVDITVAGTITINGDSAINRVIVSSSAKGAPRSISAASVAVSNADFQDITSYPTAENYGVVCIGDSITAHSYPRRLQSDIFQDTGLRVKNAGIGSETTTDMVARFDADVISTVGVQYVFILAGINDIIANQTVEQIESNLQAMYTTASNAGINVSAFTITPFQDSGYWSESRQTKLETINTWIMTTATDVDHVIDSYAALLDPDVPYKLLPEYSTYDWIHPSAKGDVVLKNLAYNSGIIWPTASVAWNLSGASGGSGDAGGNSRITFTAPITNYWKHTNDATSHNWSDSIYWFLETNGGGGAGRVPLPQDTARFDSNSFSLAGATVVQNMPRIGSVNWGNVANTPAWNTATVASMFGSLTLGTMTITGAKSSWTLEGRGSHTITSNGLTQPRNYLINNPGGLYTLQDDLILTGGITLSAGSFDDNNNDVTCTGTYSVFTGSLSSHFPVRTLTMGSGTWIVTGAAEYTARTWNFYISNTHLASISNLIINISTGTIKFTNSSATTKKFSGGGMKYNNFWFAPGAGTGSLRLEGYFDTTFNEFKDDGTEAHAIQFNGDTTTTISTWNVNGSVDKLKTIDSWTAETHTLVKSGSGLAICDYCSISESTAGPANTWFATNSTDGGTNNGWVFDSTPPTVFDLTTPVDNSWTNVTQPTLTWSASSDLESGLDKYQLYINGVLNRDNIDPTATSTTPLTALADANYTWYIKSFNNVGYERQSSQTFTVKIDSISPTLSMCPSPLNPDGLNGWYLTQPSIALLASDLVSGVNAILFHWDSSGDETYSSEFSAPEGTHTLHYSALDNAGNLVTGSQEFKTSTSPPSFDNLPGGNQPINLSDGELITDSIFNIQVTPSDTSGIERVEFSVDGTLICNIFQANVNGIYSCPWDTSKYYSNVEIIAYDLAGMTSTLTRTVITTRELPQTGRN